MLIQTTLCRFFFFYKANSSICLVKKHMKQSFSLTSHSGAQSRLLISNQQLQMSSDKQGFLCLRNAWREGRTSYLPQTSTCTPGWTVYILEVQSSRSVGSHKTCFWPILNMLIMTILNTSLIRLSWGSDGIFDLDRNCNLTVWREQRAAGHEAWVLWH